MEQRNKQEKKKENKFIKLKFIGKVKNQDIFDTNIPEEAKKIDLDIKDRPLVICIDQGMILPSIDEFLKDKKPGKYHLDLTPDKAFGERKRELIKTMPMSVFSKQNMNPQPGMILNFDGMIAKISAVSGGRVIVDFNNPLAGKEVEYDLEVIGEVTDLNEKVKALSLYFFKKEIPFNVEAKKIIFSPSKEDKNFEQIVMLFKDKFKEILDLEIEVKSDSSKESEKK
ncbi:MAG: peptidylprolyl isomerase [Nanoarchaeota archaeon]|nr:peptidylprolyl isomerase [Nanoarchaeota archaeon]